MRNKGAWLFWIGGLNGLLGAGLLATGVIMRWVLPPGSGGGGLGRGLGGGYGRGFGGGGGRWGRGGEPIQTLLSLTRHQWGDIHFWVAAAFVVAVLIHLALHFGWLKAALPRYLIPRRWIVRRSTDLRA